MDKPKGFLEESLAESQGKDVCRAIFDGSPDAIFLADPKTGLILDANPAAEQLIGRPLKDIIGMHQSALHPPKRDEASRRIFKEHAAGDGVPLPTGPEEHFALRSDGSEVPIEITASVIKIKGRKVLQGFFRDISARRAAQNALKESENKFKTITEKSMMGVYLIQDGLFRYVNPVLADLFGYSTEELVDKKGPRDLVLSEDWPLVEENLRRRVDGEVKSMNYGFRAVNKKGAVFFVEVFGTRIDYKGKPAVIGSIQDVTERKRAQEALRESEERYRTLVNHAPVGIVVHKGGVMRFVNKRMADIGNIKDPDLLVGRRILDFVHPDSRKLAVERLTQLAHAGEPPPPAEHKLVSPDGRVLDMEMNSIPISYQGEDCVMSIIQDITERKRAQDALRESETLYRSLVDNAPFGIVLHRAGEIKFVNRKMAELGHIKDPAALAGKQIMEFIHPADRETAARWLQLLVRDRLTLPPRQERLVAPDGTVFDIEMLSILINYEGEECVLSILQDVTERKRAQDELRESEARYRTLVNHTPMGIVVHAMGTIRFLNGRMAEMIRVGDAAGLLGRSVMDFLHPDYRAMVAERFRLAAGSDKPLPAAEERLLAADGTVVDVEINSVPITYRGERCLLAIVQDISARKRAQEEVNKAQAQLMEANVRLEERVEQRTAQLEELNKELEAFSYSAAHDLKAPLRRINIFSDMLEKEAGTVLKHDTHDYLVNIHKSVQNMTRLVDGLLSLSTTGRRPLELEKTDLSEVLEEALAEVKAENPGREIEWRTQKLPALKCDRSMMRQVLVNLLGNAAKYSRGRQPAVIEVFYTAGPREHVVAVRDNGIGFSMEYADKVFGVFQRLHKSDDYEGTGIGLSTVKRIISRHGGRVWAESEPGKGSTFFFALPSQ